MQTNDFPEKKKWGANIIILSSYMSSAGEYINRIYCCDAVYTFHSHMCVCT